MTCSKDFGRLLQATCLGLIGMLAVAGCGGSESPKNPDGSYGGAEVGGSQLAALNVTPMSVNLGTLGVGETTSTIVTVTNTGQGASGPITATGSAGITVSGCASSLAAGVSCQLTVGVTPTATGSFSGKVTISANPGATNPLVVAVIAQVSSFGVFKVSPSTIDLGNIAVGVAAPRQTITVTAVLGISDLTFASNGPDVSIDQAASTCTATLAAGTSCVLAVNFVAATSGVKNEGVVITGGGAQGQTINVPIAANAQAPAKLEISPTTPQTIAVAAGQTSSPISFIVANSGDVATGSVSATLTGANAASFAVTSTCLVLAPLSGCTVSVTYSPALTTTAPEAATLVVTDTGPGASSVQVAITGTPYIPTDLEITSATTDLGTVLVGQTGPSTVFTVTNKGDTASGALTIAVSSPEVVITNDTCTGVSLPKAGTCTVSLALKPTTLGVKNATLTATGAAAGSAVKQLTGGGITNGKLVATPPTLDFASVRVNNTSSAQTVTVRNEGGSATGALSFTRNGNFAVFPLAANTCSAALAPGATCTFSVSFAPVEAKSETASYTITDGTVSATVTVSGTGLPESGISIKENPVGACLEPNLLQDRASQTTEPCFAATVVNGASKTVPFIVTADDKLPNGLADTGALTVATGGTNATDFTIVSNGCTSTLLAGASCQITVAFTPTATGLRQASLNVTTANGGADSATMQGTGLAVIEIRPLDADAEENVTGLNFGQVPLLAAADPNNPGYEEHEYMVIVRGPNTETAFTSQVLTTLLDPSQPADFMYPINYYPNGINPCNTTGNQAVTLNFSTKTASAGSWYNWGTTANVFTCRFWVRFAPQSSKGEKTATLTATGTGPVSDEKTLTGVATGPLTFDPAEVDFGDEWQVGESSNTQDTITVISLSQENKTVTLINHSSTTDLGPVSLTMGGANPDQFHIVLDHCSTRTLIHNDLIDGRCEIVLAFAPTSAGAKTAVLTANAGEETTTLTLNGGAMDPFDITITPDQSVPGTNNTHDFGTMAQEGAGTWHAFTITNPAGSPRSAQVYYDVLDKNKGDRAFNLADGNNHAFGTCGQSQTTTLTAGQSCTIWVQFKPTKNHAVSNPVFPSPLTATIYAIDQAKGGASPAVVNAVGLVSSVLSIAPATYTFPDTPQGTPSTPTTLTVTNNGTSTTPLALTITSNADLAPFSVDQNTGCAGPQKSLAAGATCTLLVTFIGEGEPNLAEDVPLQVSDINYNDSAVATKLTGKTVAPAKLEAVGFDAPQTINMGGVRIEDTSGDVTLTFKNTGSAPTTSLNYFWGTGAANTPDGEFLIVGETGTTCVNKTSLAPGDTCTITVHFKPVTLQAEAHTKTFKLSAERGGEVTLFTFSAYSLSNVSSVAIGISLAGAKGFFTFPGSTPTSGGTPPIQVFQVLNGTGSSIYNTLALSNEDDFTLYLTGDNAGAAPCGALDSLIPASSTCTFGVQFNPDAAWTATSFYRHGVVSLGGGSQLGVLGRVQAPAVLSLTPATTTLPDPYDFGEVVIGGANPTRAFTITNIGEQTSAALTVTTGSPFTHAGACDGATLAAGASCIGSYSVNGGANPGPLGPETLSVTASGAQGTSATLTGMAVIATTLTVNLNTVSFPATSVGVESTTTNTITITNSTGAQTSGLLTLSLADTTNFAIADTDCPLAGDPVETEGLAGGASCEVVLSYRPMTLGTGTFPTTLVVTASPGNTQTVNVSGTAISSLKTIVNGTAMTTYNAAGAAYNTIPSALSIQVYLEPGAMDTGAISTSISGGNHMIIEDQCVTTMMTGGDSCLIKVVSLFTADTPLKTSTLSINGGSPGNTATLILNSTTPTAQ